MKGLHTGLLVCLGASILLFLDWSGLLPAAAQPRLDADTPLRFDHLSVEDGLSHTGVNAICQDRQGFLWFGTTEGLNRYDGYTFTVYAPDPDDPNSLGDAYITMIHEDRAGMLWIGTRNGGLHRFDPRTETLTRYRHDPRNPDSISDDGIVYNRGMYEAPDGILWIATWSGGFNRFDPATETFTRYRHDPDNPNSVSHDTVHAITPAAPGVPGGKLWIGTLAGLDLFDPVSGEFQHYGRGADDPANVRYTGVTAIAVEPPQSPRAGLVWVGMLNGTVAAFDPDGQSWTTLTVSDNLIEQILRNDDGTLWITTFGSGLLHVDPADGVAREYRQQERDPESLSSDMLRGLYRDRAGILWISSHNAGLNRIDPLRQQFRVYRHHDPNAGSAFDVSAIFRDRAGLIWIGTYGDGLSRFDPATGVFTPYRHDPNDAASLSHNTVGAIYEDRAGTLWVGTYGGGLNAFDRETGVFTRYLHQEDDPRSLSENNVSAILEDAQGAFWVGTVYGGLNRLDRRAGEFTAFRHDPNQPDSLVSNSIRSLYEDRAGNLWICTNSGLDRFERDQGRFRHYRHQDDDPASLSSNMVSRILEDHNGTLWVTGGLGLNRFDPSAGTFRHYFERDGLPHNRVNSILEDRQGHLWLGTADGLSKLTPATETFRNYDARDGLHGDMVYYQAAALGPQGELYVGGPGGLTVFQPDALVENPHAPPVVLTDFRLFNQSVPIGGESPLAQHIRFTNEVTLTRAQSNFELEFVALNYTAPSKNRYAYILDGFDPDWTQTDSSNRVARYTNLDPGGYTFRVKASNNDGVWNETGTSVRIVVLPAWWETWWFRSLFGAALLGVAIGAYRWRVMALRQQQRELEVLVDERTADLTRTVADYQSAEQALRDSERLLNETGSIAHIGGWELHTVTQRVRWTAEVYRIHEVSPEYRPTVETGLKFYAPEAQPIITRAVERALERGEPFDLELPLLTAAGRRRWVRTIGKAHREQGRIAKISGTFQDITDRKQAEQALRDSEERYRMLAETMEDVVWILDEQYQFTYISPSIEKLRGLTVEEALREQIADSLTPESQRTVGALMQQRQEEEQRAVVHAVDRFEIEQYCKDGSTVWVECVTKRLYDADGKTRGVIGVSRNISDRKRAEQALRDSEEQFRLAFENTSVGICLVAPDGRFLRVNRAMCEMFGYSAGELVQMTINDITHPEYVDVSPTFIRDAVSGHVISSEFEKLYYHKAGRLVWGRVISSLLLDAQGEPVHFISHVQDITRHKQAEQALQESHERFVAVMNSMEALMYVADMTTYRVLFVNRYTRDMFGDVEGQFCWQVLQAGQTGPCPFCTNAYLVQDGNPTGVYTWDFQNTVTGRWFHIQDQAIRWTDGRLVRLEIATDITDLKETQAALYEAKEIAEAARQAAELANTAKSTFLANMSHELRTPLNGILGYTQILARDPQLSAQQHNQVNVIKQSGEHLLMLINDILDLAKVEAGKIELTPNDFHLHGFLQNLCEIIRIRAEKKGVIFCCDRDERLPNAISGDERRLRQVLLNLLGNAVKFTEAGGTVTLSVSTTRQPEPDEAGPSASLRFEITDTGVGIAAEELERIFDPFQQSGADHYRAQGTGLGLAISRNLVRLMGGALQVRSQPGQGSAFWFEAPFAETRAVRRPTAVAEAGRIIGVQGPNPRLLIVDDHPNNRALLRDLLVPAGMIVAEAASGAEALEHLAQHAPDAALVDLRMPGMDGFELMQRVRDMQRRSPGHGLEDLMIIAISASAYPEDAQRSLSAGADAFLPKPVDSAQLFATLGELLSITWRVQPDTDPQQRDDVPEAPLVLPSSDDLTHLLSFAEIGDIQELYLALDRLEQQDAQFRPFIMTLRPLLQQFKIEAVSHKLREYLSS